ncbi:MAG: four helix bundle protein [Terriglobia bacterium]|jgi:four helix bundle protein
MDEAARIRSYRDLQVWQLGMDLAEACYLLTKRFPKDELFGMTSQIRRAASSVPANIAEGYGRDSTGEYIQFLRVAQGSLKELETHLTLSRRVGLMAESETEDVLEECDHLGRMLHRLIRALQRSSPTGDSKT